MGSNRKEKKEFCELIDRDIATKGFCQVYAFWEISEKRNLNFVSTCAMGNSEVMSGYTAIL